MGSNTKIPMCLHISPFYTFIYSAHIDVVQDSKGSSSAPQGVQECIARETPPVIGEEGEGLNTEIVKSKQQRTKFRSSNPADGIDIAMEESSIALEDPLTVGAFMKATVSKVPNHCAMRYKTGDVSIGITYQQYYDNCISAAKSFISVSNVNNYIYV